MDFKDYDRLAEFRNLLLAWHGKCGRQLPWRKKRTAFQILIAEVLLQQTDAGRVWPVYEAFVERFPNSKSLNRAPIKEIRRLIAPIGLPVRAKRLNKIAAILTEKYNGEVPKSLHALLELPGIGHYAAAATLCFAFGQATPLVDVNFARLYRRYFSMGASEKRPQRDVRLINLSKYIIPQQSATEFNYAILDFAATICTENRPKCKCCLLRETCAAPLNTLESEKLGIDLFAGAGGLSLGASSAGLVLAYAIEGECRAATTYEFNFPHTAVAKEYIKEGDAASLCKKLGISQSSIDVLITGPPCQGFSISNLRTRNNANPDNHAWRIIVDFIHYLRPHGVIIENVGGMGTYRNGEVTAKIRQILSNFGYNCRMFKLDAADFGVPQYRKRLFIVAVDQGVLPEEIPTNHSPIVTVGMAIKDLPMVPNDNKTDQQPYRLYGAALSQYQRKMRKRNKGIVRNCLTSKNTDLIVRRFAAVPQGGNWEDIPKDLFTTYSKPENCHRWLYRRLSEDRPSVTISNFRKNMLIHPWLDRTLSVREATRLQGFRDDFVFLGNLRSQQQQVANAVPPQMAESVTRMVLKILGRN